MTQFLSLEEREELKLQHKQERDKRVCDRIKAILLRDKGWSYEEIAAALLLTDETIRQHVIEYKASKKLKPENGGSESKLSKAQAESLNEHLQNHTYLFVKEIVAYVQATYEVIYTVAGMRHWLQSNGFSYKKPAIVPGKANAAAQKQWIEEYEKQKANLPPDEAICFADGVHPTHNTKLAYGWIKKGYNKEIQTNTGRQRINLSGVIDIISKKLIFHQDVTLNAISTIEFLKKVEASYPKHKRIHIYCDNARYFKNKLVQEFLKTSKIIMHFLPPYSPNLNPIERLWKFLNENVLNNKYYAAFTDFKHAVLGFLEGLSNPSEDILKALYTRVTDNFRVVTARFANS